MWCQAARVKRNNKTHGRRVQNKSCISIGVLYDMMYQICSYYNKLCRHPNGYKNIKFSAIWFYFSSYTTDNINLFFHRQGMKEGPISYSWSTQEGRIKEYDFMKKQICILLVYILHPMHHFISKAKTIFYTTKVVPNFLQIFCKC